MIKGTFTPDFTETEEFKPLGNISVLAYGDGVIQILRAVGEGDFYPLTDSSGASVTFDNDEPGGVIVNFDMINSNRVNRYKLAGDTATEIHYKISWGF